MSALKRFRGTKVNHHIHAPRERPVNAFTRVRGHQQNAFKGLQPLQQKTGL